MKTDGSAFTNLHNFTGGTDGGGPQGDLIISGNVLYGTTFGAGGQSSGSIFRINTDGTGFTNLYRFSAIPHLSSTNSDGANPYAGLVLSGNTLYGTAYAGGRSGYGTVFAVNTDGAAFTVLHTFTAISNPNPPHTNYDGANPYGGLILWGDTLYATASAGGALGQGAVFAINTNGTSFTNLHSLALSEGGAPYGGLVTSDGVLYGTAYAGGISGWGTVFKGNTDGTGLTNIYSFPSGTIPGFTNSDGANLYARLLLSGDTMYGTAFRGGTSGLGTVFALNRDGSGFLNLHSFSSATNDGARPYAGLVRSGNNLYGTTYAGGTITTFADGVAGNGTVFRVSLPPPQLSITLSGQDVILTWPTNAAFGLQTGATPTGSFTNVPGAQSPYTNAIGPAQQFFRLSPN